ncbi:unnamed protein product [Owenia fusiformis]|uniref:Uncharacterized protein n=1 Tax=Owenia fusiformis TaxID=6347 RepID=A0A8J1TAP9_OWEFU|nr:unnamed protein product [Owenia fusiformis]
MNIESGDRLFTIASCGANAMTLLLDDPAEVVALDLSIPQLHLAKLQAACIKHLSHQEFIDFTGVDRENVKPEERVRIYRAIKGSLELPTQEYWDSRMEAVEFGVMHCGDFDINIRTAAEDFFFVALDQSDIKRFLSMGDDMKEQSDFFENVMNTKYFRRAVKRLIQRLLSDFNLSIFPDVDYPKFYGRRMEEICKTIPAKRNHCIEYILTGGYSGKYNLRDYQLKENFPILKERIDRLEWIQGELTDWLRKYPLSKQPMFDCVCVSNVTDWLTIENHNLAIRSAGKICKQGGRIVFWNGQGMAKYWPSEMVDTVLKVEHEIEAECVKYDRMIFWEPLRVATVL